MILIDLYDFTQHFVLSDEDHRGNCIEKKKNKFTIIKKKLTHREISSGSSYLQLLPWFHELFTITSF